jgi:hypothetical protein
MALHARISSDMRSDSPNTAGSTVFVDSTGHRARMLRRTGYGFAGVASTYVVVLGLSLLGATPFAPGVLLPVPGVSGAPAAPEPGALGSDGKDGAHLPPALPLPLLQDPRGLMPSPSGAPGVWGRMPVPGGLMPGNSTLASGPSALLVPGLSTVTGGPPSTPGTSPPISAPVPPATAGPAAEGPQVPDAPQAPETPVPPPPPDQSPAPDAPSPAPAPDTGTPPLPEPPAETPLPTPSATVPAAPSEAPSGPSTVPPSDVPVDQAS